MTPEERAVEEARRTLLHSGHGLALARYENAVADRDAARRPTALPPRYLEILEEVRAVPQTFAPPAPSRDLSPRRLTFPLLLAALLVAIGVQVRVMGLSPQLPLDDPAHFLFPCCVGSIAARELFRNPVQLRPLQAFLVVVAFGVTAEALWECLEYMIDDAWGWGWQLDNVDTMWDLITGFAGALFGATVHVAFDYLDREG